MIKYLIYDFPGSHTIGNNCPSQNFQDLFVISFLQGKRNGSYLEIGGYAPVHMNNTFLLSKIFNWTGVSIEIEDYRDLWKLARPKDKFLHSNALTIDYRKLLSENYNDNIIDYLQLDIDPSINTLSALKLLPLDEYKFRVITFETDLYVGDERARRESREILLENGYELVVSDVRFENKPFEDWWAHPDLVDKNILKDIKTRGIITQNPYELLLK